MRKELVKELLGTHTINKENIVFLTGDLGYATLEPLREILGDRFINAGVAEQNMVSMAAGLSHAGFRPWCYSIAPFMYARPFEQIRNDVVMHNRHVVMVGNGGGYGYGVMGSSHHALEDIAVMSSLGVKTYVPAFNSDMPVVVNQLLCNSEPAYLRLGVEEITGHPWHYAPYRKLIDSTKMDTVVVATGPIIGSILKSLKVCRPKVWLVSEFPMKDVPFALVSDCIEAENLVIVEEHKRLGGLGSQLFQELMMEGDFDELYSGGPKITHLYADSFDKDHKYGSQIFERKSSGLDQETIIKAIYD